MENTSLSLNAIIKMLTFQLNFVSEAYIMDLVQRNISKCKCVRFFCQCVSERVLFSGLLEVFIGGPCI